MTSTAQPAGLLRASGSMAAGTVVSRVTGFARSIVLFAALGSHVLADTYNVANTLPNVLYILIAGGVLNSVLVPQLVRAMRTDADGGQAYAERLLSLSASVLLAVTVLLTAAAPLVIRVYASSKWSAADMAVATAFAFLCLPQIFFYGVFTMLGQVLNARGRFGPMMWAPVLNNLVVITVGLLFLGVTGPSLSTASIGPGATLLLGLGTTLGIIVQTVALVPYVRASGLRLRPRFDWRGHGLGRAGELAKWMVLFVAANQIAFWVVVRLATAAGKEAQNLGVAHGSGFTPYYQAQIVWMLPQAVVTVSVVTALLPRMSAAAGEGRPEGVREGISTGLRLPATVIVPSAVFFLLFGPDLGVALFAYGHTSVADASYIGLVLSAFALGLVPFAAQHVLLRGFYALEDTRTPFLISLLINAVNVAAAVVAYTVLPPAWKTVGLGAAYAAAYLVGTPVAAAILRRRIGGIEGARVTRTLTRLGVAAFGAGASALLLERAVHRLLADSRIASICGLLLAALVMGPVYLWLTRRLRVQEVTDLLGTVRGRLAG